MTSAAADAGIGKRTGSPLALVDDSSGAATAPSAAPRAKLRWPCVASVVAIVAGVVAFVVPPVSTATDYGAMASTPGPFLQYGAAVALTICGTVLGCTGLLVTHLRRD